MAEDREAEDRTEAPTQRRLDTARQQGQVPLSREATAFATLLAATVAGFLTLPPLGASWIAALRTLLEAVDPGAAAEAGLALLRTTALGILPVLAAVTLAGVLASLGQTGLLLRGEALVPDLARLGPGTALRRWFGTEGLIELGRTLLKLGVVGLALWLAVDLDALQAALHRPVGALPASIGHGALRLLVVALAAFGVIAMLDLLLVRWRHLRKLRMSREDMRQEMRDAEGDPQIKARLRRLRESRARQRMLAAVPKATVVITNPTHYAIALKYEAGQSAAPRLVAKGVDEMAARIRAVAAEHGVPIVANPPLARALFRLDADTEIPAEHWQAVAGIIAYVWRLQGRTGAPHAAPGD